MWRDVMPKLGHNRGGSSTGSSGTGSSQRTSALVRLFEETGGRGRGGRLEPATLTRYNNNNTTTATTSGTNTDTVVPHLHKPLSSPPLSPASRCVSLSGSAVGRVTVRGASANMVFNYSDYQQQVVSAGGLGRAAAGGVTGSKAAAVAVPADVILPQEEEETGAGVRTAAVTVVDTGDNTVGVDLGGVVSEQKDRLYIDHGNNNNNNKTTTTIRTSSSGEG